MDQTSSVELRRRAPHRATLVILVLAIAATIAGIVAYSSTTTVKDSTASISTASISTMSVPGMGAVVKNVPKGWTMRPSSEWALTWIRGETVVATSSWWAPAEVIDAHSAVEICDERVDQATCVTSGDSVISEAKLPGGKRATVSFRTNHITDDFSTDRKIWQQVVVRCAKLCLRFERNLHP